MFSYVRSKFIRRLKTFFLKVCQVCFQVHNEFLRIANFVLFHCDDRISMTFSSGTPLFFLNLVRMSSRWSARCMSVRRRRRYSWVIRIYDWSPPVNSTGPVLHSLRISSGCPMNELSGFVVNIIENASLIF